MRLCVFLVVCLTPSLLSAQVHPCDQPDQTTATKGSKTGWCHDLKDADGFVVNANAIGFRLSVAGVLTDLGARVPIGSPSQAGLYYFEASLPTATGRGLYPVYVEAYSAEGTSPPSTTITWQVGGPPNKPQKPRIVQWLQRLATAPLAGLR